MGQEFYELEALDMQSKPVKMDAYRGKTVMVVNTATKCGLAPQFDGLEKLYQDYKDKGFVILGFPSNQFANQEPGNDEQVAETCRVNFGVTFPLFSKVEVNGKNTHPVFKYLKSNLKGLFGSRVKWNFTKFLIDKNGQPVKRFSPTTKPEEIESYLKKIV